MKRYWQDSGWRFGARTALTVFIVFMLLTISVPALSDSAWWPLQVILDVLAIGGAALFILPRRMTLFTAAAGILLVFGALAAYESTQLTGYYDVALGRFKEEWSIAGHAYKANIRIGNMASHYSEITGMPLPEPEWRMTWRHNAGAIADGPSSMVRDFEKVWESYERSLAPPDIKKRIMEAAAEVNAFQEGSQPRTSSYAKRLYLKELKRYLGSFDASGRTVLPFPDAKAFMEKWRKEAAKR